MEIVDTMDDSLLETTIIPNTHKEVKEVDRKLRSPKNVRKKISSGASDSTLDGRKRQEELHTPTPLDDSLKTFEPSLMSTINQSSVSEVVEESSIQIVPIINDSIVVPDHSKSAFVDTKSMINLSIQNPVNADEWISLNGFNLLSYAHMQDGTYFLPLTQKILIEIPTDQLLKSMSAQSDTKIILSDSIQSLNTTNITAKSNGSFVTLDSTASTVNESSYVTKFGKLKPLKVYEHVDFTAPISDAERECTEVGFTDEQRKILNQQLRMHIQLTTQNYLQTYSHPRYWQQASTYSSFLDDLVPILRWSEQLEALTSAIDLTQRWQRDVDVSGKYLVESVFNILPLRIKLFYHYLLHSWFYQEWELEKESKKNIKRWYKPKLCPKIMETMLSHPVFAFPKLLPEIALKSDYFMSKNKSEMMTGEEM